MIFGKIEDNIIKSKNKHDLNDINYTFFKQIKLVFRIKFEGLPTRINYAH